MEHIVNPAFMALLQVILIDIVLAGDNAVVIGMGAAGSQNAPAHRDFLACGRGGDARGAGMLTATLLEIIGLMFAGGILLLWVSWRLYRDIHHAHSEVHAEAIIDTIKIDVDETGAGALLHSKAVRRAVVQIMIADLSMSLDNVLAVAGAAMDHIWVLSVGLLLSIALMGIAANMIAALLQKHPWISYAGLIIVVYVALRMIWFGGWEVFHAAL